jgi:hypothetical protein
MADKKKALAVPREQESLSRRTLVRAFESHIASKVQTEHGQEGDRQAPMTVLRNEDGSPKKLVIVTTDSAFAKEVHEAINSKVGVAVRMHRAPTDNELEELAKELPMPTVPAALPPAATKPALALVPKPVEPPLAKGAARPATSCVDPWPSAQPFHVQVYDESHNGRSTSAVLHLIEKSGHFRLVSEAYDWLVSWNERGKNQGFVASARIYNGADVERVYDRPRSRLQRVL